MARRWISSFPACRLEKIREIGLRLQRGGVGFYPTSGSPFVHMDTGTIRHWPRMTHDQLAKVFPDGRTVHIPSDGQPLRGYALALADVERRGGQPSETSLEAAREAGVITANFEPGAAKPKRSIFARLFGSHKDADEVSEEPAPKQARTPTAVASLSPPKAHSVAVEHIVPLPTARPQSAAVAVVAATPKPAARTVVTASLGGNLFDNRGYWRGAVQTGPELPAVAAQKVFETASVEPKATGSTALAYASASEALAPARTRPMGSRMPQLPQEASVMPAQGNTTTVAKPALATAGANSSLAFRQSVAARGHAHAERQRLHDDDAHWHGRHAAASGAALQAVYVGDDVILDRPAARHGGQPFRRPGGGLRGDHLIRVPVDRVAALIT